MSMQATFRLVDATVEDVAMEDRRVAPRNPVSGQATALQCSSPEHGNRKRIYSLNLLNISDRGLGAVVRDPMEVNSAISVIFSPHGPESGIHRHGRVVWCSATAGGHEIGVRFDSLPAA